MSAPAAIASAVDDALSQFGIVTAELPITPTALWRKVAQPS
jgi:CO/xanthine dehydrogenase Mo-binding subunit